MGNLELVSEDDRARMQNHAKSAADVIFVNCWHLSDVESAAMWRLYSAWDRGIAIRTTVKGLTSSLTCAEDIYIGAVKYIDYGSTQEIDRSNIFSPYLTKRKSFEYEQEVRAITMNAGPDDADRLGTSAEWIETGIYYSVDLDVLVDEVLVAPQSEDWFVDLVQAVVKKYGLDAAVTRSALAGQPPWWVPRSQRLPGLLDELSQVLGEDFQLITSSDAKVSHRSHQGEGVHYGDYESYVRLHHGVSRSETEAET